MNDPFGASILAARRTGHRRALAHETRGSPKSSYCCLPNGEAYGSTCRARGPFSLPTHAVRRGRSFLSPCLARPSGGSCLRPFGQCASVPRLRRQVQGPRGAYGCKIGVAGAGACGRRHCFSPLLLLVRDGRICASHSDSGL